MLTKRLETVGKLVDQNDKIADIGTDHAYLPIMLVKNQTIKAAIASDIGEGPTKNARENVKRYGLNEQIEVRLGPGVEPIMAEDKVDTVIIAGMGGKLISDILQDGVNEGKQFPKLILEPNIGEPVIRRWLMNHDYKIVAEDIMAEDGHTYEIIKAVLTSEKQTLTDAELLLGPFLKEEKNEVFLTKWHNQLAYFKNLLLNLQKANVPDEQKISLIKDNILAIEEVLQSDTN